MVLLTYMHVATVAKNVTYVWPKRTSCPKFAKVVKIQPT